MTKSDYTPILFTDRMIEKILSGEKTQTRRVVKPQPNGHYWQWLPGYKMHCLVLDTISGKYARFSHHIPRNPCEDGVQLIKCPYVKPLAVKQRWRTDKQYDKLKPSQIPTSAKIQTAGFDVECDGKWRSPLFMPLWAVKIFLDVKNIRCERLKYISAIDARAEGCELSSFRDLWDEINLKRGFGWDGNPMVWVIKFEMRRNSD